MKTLRISKEVELPLDVITQTIAILAKRRAGKSYTMRKLVEQLLENSQQVVLVDPKGDQWGLRSSADGKKKGYPIVILGGEHGDAPLEASAGEVVAKLVVEERVSVLLDLSLFSKGEVARFMAIFLETLYRMKAQERYRTPVMVVIDEADAIAPQKPQRGEERMLGAADDIVRRGGQRGIGCALITQRSAVLNKNVLTQAQMLIVLRTIAPQDLAAMKAWIDVHGTDEQGKEMMSSLPSLPIGDAYFWSPGWPTDAGIFKRGHVLPIETFDSGATPAPGHKQIIPKNLADVDLEVLKKQMSATIEKAKQDDPKFLKKQISELEARIRTQTPEKEAAPMGVSQWREYGKKYGYDSFFEKKAVDEAVKAVIKQKDEEFFLERGEWLKQIDSWFRIIKELGEAMTKAKAEWSKSKPPMKRVEATVITAADMAAVEPGEIMKVVNKRTDDMKRDYDRSIDLLASESDLTGPEQRILNGIAWMNAIGVDQPSRVAVAFLADYSSNSSGYTKACGALRTKGLVEYVAGNQIELTAAGRNSADVLDTPTSNRELHEKIYSRLSPAEVRVLSPIVQKGGEEIPKSELAPQAEYSENSSGFVKILGKLRTLGLIGYSTPPGSVYAEKILFPL